MVTPATPKSRGLHRPPSVRSSRRGRFASRSGVEGGGEKSNVGILPDASAPSRLFGEPSSSVLTVLGLGRDSLRVCTLRQFLTLNRGCIRSCRDFRSHLSHSPTYSPYCSLSSSFNSSHRSAMASGKTTARDPVSATPPSTTPSPNGARKVHIEAGLQPDAVYAAALSPWRNAIRRRFVKNLEAESEWIASIQRQYRTKGRDKFFFWSAVFGSEFCPRDSRVWLRPLPCNAICPSHRRSFTDLRRATLVDTSAHILHGLPSSPLLRWTT